MKLSSKTLKGLRIINIVLGVMVLGFYIGQIVAREGKNYSQNTILFVAAFALFGGTASMISQACKKNELQEGKEN